MQSEEQRLIDGLFSRLKEAEAHSASRDASAEERIAQHVSAQPAAPYYMAQTILIQEAAIKQLNDRIQALESQVSQLQAAKPSSGGFLSGLFGGGGSSPQEIVNIIEEKPQPDAASAQDSIAQDTTAGDDPFRQGDDQFRADNTWNDDFDAGFGDDDFGSDDDSWV